MRAAKYWTELTGFAVLVAAAGVFAWWPATPPQRTSEIAFARGVLRKMSVGHLNGRPPAQPITIDPRGMEPGDILVWHNPACAYGYWSHAGLYVGHGMVADAADFVRGTRLRPIREYQYYERAVVLRPLAPEEIRRASAEVARQQIGKMYDPFTPMTDGRREYCSKLVWEAYNRVGYRLCTLRTWIVPDDLYASRVVRVVADIRKGEGRGTRPAR